MSDFHKHFSRRCAQRLQTVVIQRFKGNRLHYSRPGNLAVSDHLRINVIKKYITE